MRAIQPSKATCAVTLTMLAALAGCSTEELLEAVVDTVLTTGPITAEATYEIWGERVTPGYTVPLTVDWSAPCGKGGRCKHQPFAAEIDCGAIPCEVERFYAPHVDEDVAPLISEVGRMTLLLRPGAVGLLGLTLILTQLETGEIKRVSPRTLVVERAAKLGIACMLDDEWQSCPSTARHGEYFELAVWAQTLEGKYVAVEPRVTLNGEGYDAVEISCGPTFLVQDGGFTLDPYVCRGAYGVPGPLTIEAEHEGIVASHQLTVTVL